MHPDFSGQIAADRIASRHAQAAQWRQVRQARDQKRPDAKVWRVRWRRRPLRTPSRPATT
jgi:hypothetical protein